VIKVLHIITCMDMGGSAQNTLLTGLKLSRKFKMALACSLSHESNMADAEREALERQLEKARINGVNVVSVPSLVRRISPVNDIRALYDLVRIIKPKSLMSFTPIPPKPAY